MNLDFFYSIRLLFRKEKRLFRSIKAITGFLPHDIALYQEAFTAKSMLRRSREGRPVNNERLEFLGDAILGAVVADIVYKHFPNKPEGFLTNTRSKIVDRASLGQLAHTMGITALLQTGQASSSHNSYVGGNAFEALVGALYLDRGYAACMKFVKKKIFASLVDLDREASRRINFKSQLLEWTQKRHIDIDFTPLPTIHSAGGEPVFVYMVTINGVSCGKGKGFSKKEAQQNAAEETMKRIHGSRAFAAYLLHPTDENATAENAAPQGDKKEG